MKNLWRKQIAFLLPSLLGLTAFFLVPLFYCVVFSASRTFGRFRFAGADNYLSLLGSRAFRLAYGNTFVLMTGYIAALLVLSLAVSYILENSRGTMAFLAAMSAAMFLPSVLVVRFVGILPGAAENAPRLVFLFIFLWKHAGINALILRSASNRMDPAWREAAMIDGAGKGAFFRHVEFFYLLPYLKFLFIFDTTCFFKLFRESYLLYGLYPPDGVYMIQNFFFNNFENANYQRLSSGGTIAVLTLFAVNLLVYKAGEKREIAQ